MRPSFSFFPILLCNHTGDCPEEELAKFGYKSERKVEKFKNPAIFLQPAGNYFLLVALFSQKRNSQKSLAEKKICRLVMKICPQKKLLIVGFETLKTTFTSISRHLSMVGIYVFLQPMCSMQPSSIMNSYINYALLVFPLG